METTFSYTTKYTVDDFNSHITTVYATLNEAMEALRQIHNAFGILTIEVTHMVKAYTLKGASCDYRTLTYNSNGKLKTLYAYSMVFGKNKAK